MGLHAWITRLKPGRIGDYERAHKTVPAEVDAAIRDAGVTRYAIFRHDHMLIGTFECDDVHRTVHRLLESDALKRWRAQIDALLDHASDPATGFRPLLPLVWELPEHTEGPQRRPLAPSAISGFDDLRGKAVLVTGASTGIGAAVAQAFGACGARVAIHYNRSAGEAEQVADAVRAAGGEAVILQADLADARNAGALVKRAAAALGGLDVLINNAGHVLGRTPIAETSDQRFHAIMDLNFTSLFMACRAAIPLLRAHGGGAIVNTSSVAARIGGGPGAAIYGAAKAAVSNFSRGLAKELVRDRIRVNVVAPGVIETPLHVQLTPPEAWGRFLGAVPMARAGTPEECAGAYLYLASERLSSYVTGQVIEVNGGQLMP